MKRLIVWDDATDAVEICDDGWRDPYPGELNRLAQILDIKPRGMARLEVLVVLFVITVIVVGGIGGVWG